jgi:hypothetical protein
MVGSGTFKESLFIHLFHCILQFFATGLMLLVAALF